jgi:predicted HAD superfamily phosphohydrolase YqeG
VTHRRELRRLLGTATCEQVTQITPHRLHSENIAVLVLDFDGVLAPHGYDKPLPEVAPWLKECAVAPCLKRIYIMSNKPTPQRERYFAEHHPKFRFVKGVRKKPYPDGLLNIIAAEAVTPRQVLLVDDRLLTGILATILAGTRCILVTRPYVDYACKSFSEAGFVLIRTLERAFIRLM